MMAVNLGTRGTQEAADLLEYCNVAGKPIGATYSWTGQICCSHSKWRCTPSVHTAISKRGGSTIRGSLRTVHILMTCLPM